MLLAGHAKLLVPALLPVRGLAGTPAVMRGLAPGSRPEVDGGEAVGEHSIEPRGPCLFRWRAWWWCFLKEVDEVSDIRVLLFPLPTMVYGSVSDPKMVFWAARF